MEKSKKSIFSSLKMALGVFLSSTTNFRVCHFRKFESTLLKSIHFNEFD